MIELLFSPTYTYTPTCSMRVMRALTTDECIFLVCISLGSFVPKKEGKIINSF